jgi:hypothetical protein
MVNTLRLRMPAALQLVERFAEPQTVNALPQVMETAAQEISLLFAEAHKHRASCQKQSRVLSSCWSITCLPLQTAQIRSQRSRLHSALPSVFLKPTSQRPLPFQQQRQQEADVYRKRR